MATGGINLVLVRKAREALLSRGQNPRHRRDTHRTWKYRVKDYNSAVFEGD